MTKKIGIALDNYKLRYFKRSLERKGYKKYDVNPFMKKENTSFVSIEVSEPEFEIHKAKINAICIDMENHFKRQN